MRFCFLTHLRICNQDCMAFDQSGKHSPCKLLNSTERLLKLISPVQSKPVAPAPKVRP